MQSVPGFWCCYVRWRQDLDDQDLVSFFCFCRCGFLIVGVGVGTDKVSLCFFDLPDLVAFTYARPFALPQPADHCRDRHSGRARTLCSIRLRMCSARRGPQLLSFTRWDASLTFCLSRNTGQQPQSQSRSDCVSLETHRHVRDSLDKLRSRIAEMELHGAGSLCGLL